MSSLGIKPSLLALQTSMHPLYYGTLLWVVQKLFDSDCKRVGKKEPPPGVKCSKYTSDPIGLGKHKVFLRHFCKPFLFK